MLVEASDRSCLLDIAGVAKASDRLYIKIFSPKQMLQRLPVALVQVKAGNTSENIRQIIYALYRAKNITEKVYNNVHCTKNEVFH